MLFEESHIETVREPLPEWGVDAFAAITNLGDPLVFILLVSLVYWLTDHATGLRVIAALLLVFGLRTGLKELLAVERPPPAVRAIEAEGFGIPSGHAAGSTAVYRDTARVPRGRTEIKDFRDEERRSLSNQLTPRVNRVSYTLYANILKRTVATRIEDLNPKQLPAVAKRCDTSQNAATADETGVVGRGGAADPHGHRAFGC
ncbi:MAG: PAP2 superfamily protein [halophilic archaeon J07HX64]|nr:MAG: PAP2 superfamily protein [halophilic archaeon J07HX64]